MNLHERFGLTPEVLPQQKIDEFLNEYKNSLLESEDFLKSIPAEKIPAEIRNHYLNQGISKVDGITRKTLKTALGLSDDELNDLSEDEKKEIHKFINKSFEKYKAKQPNFNADLNNLQNELLSKNNQIAEITTQIEELKNGTQTEIQKALQEQQTNFIAFQNATKLSGNVIGDFGYLFDGVFAKIKNDYAVLTNGNEIELRKKDNPEFKVKVTNEGKEEFLTFEKALELGFKKVGLWKNNEPPADPKIKMPIDFGTGSQDLLEALQRARQ